MSNFTTKQTGTKGNCVNLSDFNLFCVTYKIKSGRQKQNKNP